MPGSEERAVFCSKQVSRTTECWAACSRLQAPASAGKAKGTGMYITGKSLGSNMKEEEGAEQSIDWWNEPSWNTV